MARPGDIGDDDTGAPDRLDDTGAPDRLDDTGAPDRLDDTGASDDLDTTGADLGLAMTEMGAEPVKRDGHLPPGTRVGRYVLGGVLGEGGMGVVYAASDPELGREVAVKMVRGAAGGSGQNANRRRMVREAQAMARVSHPNVIAVYDAGTFGGEVFIAMELVRGRSLRAWLGAGRRSVAEVLDAFSAAGRGLAAAHAAGLVHRDFKPDNVLVGDDGRVRVTDFGLAMTDGDPEVVAGSALSGDDDESLPQTLTAGIVGTPPYMAPEQHSGGVTDARSDQFSFCVALYEALHGERPFGGRNRDEVSRAIHRGVVAAPPPDVRVPGSLRQLILRGLSVRPGDRFTTMDSLLRALGRDRGRLPRRIASVAAVALLVVAVAFGADWIVRDRAAAVTRTSFAAARAQLGRLLALRTEAFAATSDLTNAVPVLREVAGNLDQSDFGLGAADDDQSRLAGLHDHLASADWVLWAGAAQGGTFAIADYKGRLLYASAAPERWGTDVMAVPAVAAAYRSGGDAGTSVVRGDAPEVVASGLLGGSPRPGLHVLFSRVTVVGDQPRALFLQSVSGARLLSEVSPGAGTLMSLAALDGTFEGPVPPEVIRAGLGASTDVEAIERGGHSWLVQRYPMISDGAQPIANLVLARQLDVGLEGLFPGARGVLAALSVLLAAAAVAGVIESRRRDLSRHALQATRRARPRGRVPTRDTTDARDHGDRGRGDRVRARGEPPEPPPPAPGPPVPPMAETQVSES